MTSREAWRVAVSPGPPQRRAAAARDRVENRSLARFSSPRVYTLLNFAISGSECVVVFLYSFGFKYAKICYSQPLPDGHGGYCLFGNSPERSPKGYPIHEVG